MSRLRRRKRHCRAPAASRRKRQRPPLACRLSRIWPQGCWQSGPTPAPDAPAVWSRYRSPAVTDNASMQQRRQAAIPRGVATAMPIFAARAENAELWDADGRRHVDFAGGIAVLHVGHRHPKVVAAVREQLDLYTQPAFQVTAYRSYVARAARLHALDPTNGPARNNRFHSEERRVRKKRVQM